MDVRLDADDSERNALFTRSAPCGPSLRRTFPVLSHVTITDLLFYHLRGALSLSRFQHVINSAFNSENIVRFWMVFTFY